MPTTLRDIVNKTLKEKRYIIHSFNDIIFRNELFPFLVGLYQETKRKIDSYFYLVYRETIEREFLNNLFFNIFGKYPGDRKRSSEENEDRRIIRFSSGQVTDVIKELTGNNTHPPYLILTSKKRKLRYLGGFLYRGAKIYEEAVHLKRPNISKIWPRVYIYGKTKTGLLRKIQDLLKEFDIFSANKKNGFTIYRLQSLKQLLTLKLLSPIQKNNLEILLTDLEEPPEIIKHVESAKKGQLIL